MYEDAFETKFLKATEALYHEEGNRYMQETDVSYVHVLHELFIFYNPFEFILFMECIGYPGLWPLL